MSVVAVRTCAVGLLGFGRVGQAIAELASSAADRFEQADLNLELTAALIRDPHKPRNRNDIQLVENPARFFAHRFDVVIEVMGGVYPAFEYVRHALEIGVPVVTANKSLMAQKGQELRAIARRTGVPLYFDAAVLAGVPFIGAVARRPFVGSPRRITGILNGTSHFLACALADGRSFEEALGEAIDLGYAEPDSAADISGRDAAEKLTILAHLAGCTALTTGELTTIGLDKVRPLDFEAAAALGAVIKPIATASFDSNDPGAWIGPALVDATHPAAASRGVHNYLEYVPVGGASTPAAGAVTFAGPGAGPSVTASTILDDVAEVLASDLRTVRQSREQTRRTPDLSRPSAGAWYVRVADAAIGIHEVAEHLSDHHVPAVRIARAGGAIAARTIGATWGAVNEAADALRAIGADVLVLPVIVGEGGDDVRN